MQRRVDVRARQDGDGGTPGDEFSCQQGGGADGGGPFDDMALPVQMADAFGNLGLGQQDDLIQQIAAQGKGHAVLQADAAAQTVGQRRCLGDLDRTMGRLAQLSSLITERFFAQPGMAERNLSLDWWPIGTGRR